MPCAWSVRASSSAGMPAVVRSPLKTAATLGS